MCVLLNVYVSVSMSGGVHRSEASGTLKLQVSYLAWVLGTELKSSLRAMCSLTLGHLSSLRCVTHSYSAHLVLKGPGSSLGFP